MQKESIGFGKEMLMLGKRKWKKLVAGILVLGSLSMPYSVFGADLDKPITEVEADPVTCDLGCGGMCYYVCNHNWIYDSDNSYTHNFGKCSVRVYACTYTGFKCEFCDHVQSMSALNMSGYHLCHEIHSSCGKGSVSTCKEGCNI